MKLSEAYYQAVNDKDIARVEAFIHPDIRFVGPMMMAEGKDKYMPMLRSFITMFKSITIRNVFEKDDKEMVVYDLNCMPPMGSVRAAALFTIKDGLISEIELFYDTNPFQQKS